MYAKGIRPKEISKILNLSYRQVEGWVYDFNRYKNTRNTQNMLAQYEDWISKATKGIENKGFVWEKIISKKSQILDDVRDFTTLEHTHSFIANGFITHNCPIETPEGTPIGLRKNLAFMCAISQEEYSEDKIKKLLEGVGLKAI